jgi:hypothetical protein
MLSAARRANSPKLRKRLTSVGSKPSDDRYWRKADIGRIGDEGPFWVKSGQPCVVDQIGHASCRARARKNSDNGSYFAPIRARKVGIEAESLAEAE